MGGNVGYAATEGSLNIKNLNELLRFYDFVLSLRLIFPRDRKRGRA